MLARPTGQVRPPQVPVLPGQGSLVRLLPPQDFCGLRGYKQGGLCGACVGPLLSLLCSLWSPGPSHSRGSQGEGAPLRAHVSRPCPCHCVALLHQDSYIIHANYQRGRATSHTTASVRCLQEGGGPRPLGSDSLLMFGPGPLFIPGLQAPWTHLVWEMVAPGHGVASRWGEGTASNLWPPS